MRRTVTDPDFALQTAASTSIYFFFERSLELLDAQGRLAFITPNKYLTSVSAAPLRTLLRETASVRTIAEFDSHKVFANAAIVPCVTVIDRAHDSSTTTYAECQASEGSVEIHRQSRHVLPLAEWRLQPSIIRDLLTRLRTNHPPLSSFVTRISAGVATGLDKVFVVPTIQAERLRLEQELRHPAVRGKDVQAGSIRTSDMDVIIPYRSIDSAPPTLIDISEYPATREYLSKYRRDLEQRHCVRVWKKQWYDTHDPWTFNIATTPKILVPDIAFSNRFAPDKGERCPLHSAYYIIPTQKVDINFLTTVLNSDITEFCIRATAPIMKDGFIRYRKQFLQELPIPECTPHQQREIADAAAGPPGGERIDDTLARLFGLGPSDLTAIRSYLGRLRNSPPVPRDEFL